MMMSFGTFVFSMSTAAYQELQRQQAWRYGAGERVGARAALQFLGPGEDTIQLAGLIAPELTGTRASLDTLRDLADGGEALPLVDGAGKVYGNYVIQQLAETSSLFFKDGVPRRIEFQLSLKRGDDASTQGAAA